MAITQVKGSRFSGSHIDGFVVFTPWDLGLTQRIGKKIAKRLTLNQEPVNLNSYVNQELKTAEMARKD